MLAAIETGMLIFWSAAACAALGSLAIACVLWLIARIAEDAAGADAAEAEVAEFTEVSPQLPAGSLVYFDPVLGRLTPQIKRDAPPYCSDPETPSTQIAGGPMGDRWPQERDDCGGEYGGSAPFLVRAQDEARRRVASETED